MCNLENVSLLQYEFIWIILNNKWGLWVMYESQRGRPYPKGTVSCVRLHRFISTFYRFCVLEQLQISTCVTLLSFSYVIRRMVIRVSGYLMEL